MMILYNTSFYTLLFIYATIYVSGDFINYVVSGLSFSDVTVQLAVTFVCIQLYNRLPTGQMVPDSRTTQSLVTGVMKNLQETTNNDVLINLIGTIIIYLARSNTCHHCNW